MLVTSIFSFSHNVFKPFKDKNRQIKYMFFFFFILSSENAFNLGQSKILTFGKGLNFHYLNSSRPLGVFLGPLHINPLPNDKILYNINIVTQFFNISASGLSQEKKRKFIYFVNARRMRILAKFQSIYNLTDFHYFRPSNEYICCIFYVSSVSFSS